MRIDYQTAAYHCVNQGEYATLLHSLDPFVYSLPVWWRLPNDSVHPVFRRIIEDWLGEWELDA